MGLDFETYSEVDLKKVGTSRYARACEPLMLAYDLEDERQWVPAEGECMPRDLRDALRDPDVIKTAWNKTFEWSVLTHALGIETPHDQWRDTMVAAMALALPASLDQCGPIVGLPASLQKDNRGKLLIRRFCMPRTPTKAKPYRRETHLTSPLEWGDFKGYNRQDLKTEKGIWGRIKQWDMPPEEWELWYLDQEINQRGLPINMRLVRNAIKVSDQIVEERIEEMRKITGLDNPNSNEQLLDWLIAQGYPFDDVKKGHIERALDEAKEDDRTDDLPYRKVLSYRLEISRASIKKFHALARATDDDGRLRNSLQFCAAGRTRRFGGRIYQPQNLLRPPKHLEKHLPALARDAERMDAKALRLVWGSPMEALSACVRPVVEAPHGLVFIDADLNAIENRVLGWIAYCNKILQVFRDGRDPYIDFATYMYGRPYDELAAEYKGGDGEKRTISKPAVLGCGYMLSGGNQYEDETTGEIRATGLLGYAWNMAVKLTPEQATKSVEVWRKTFDDVVAYWYEISDAAFRCIRTGKPQDAGKVWFDVSGPFMRMNLPSGGSLYYCRPAIEMRMKPWGEKAPTIIYWGMNDKNQWTKIETHPGKLTENADQAIARDLLCHGMMLAKKRGIDGLFLHVHDQAVAMVREDEAEAKLKVLEECMSETPRWAPGLPMAAKGHISRVFIKG